MVLRLARHIGQDREIDVGYGVVFRFGPISYAAFKEAEAGAHRLARETVDMATAVALEASEIEDLDEEAEDHLRGRFAECLILLLCLRFGTGWDGVELENGEAAPFRRNEVSEFLSLFPGVALTLQQRLLSPFEMVSSEGKGSAPSPNTASPAV